ncbi:hypothetical protein N7462_004400 [Penicillium macrosclerotiorum]|uniref:uncharacterized protein n=1 Tax=Penicillium macrosclerotiorum TaxID=303699 RepID=UPI0025475FC2|nr:uncharacterized protein N7462_004400 [Penicillium macrosclerotiorum]KAJ5690008.1 hypothetical protein N7462_004400 [Penicillium macrosclerotiorum]
MYPKWTDKWNENFDIFCNQSGNLQAPVFQSRAEQVTWNVTGWLLAWRNLMSPPVESIKFHCHENQYYDLEQGEETSLTLKFHEDQNHYLSLPQPTEE